MIDVSGLVKDLPARERWFQREKDKSAETKLHEVMAILEEPKLNFEQELLAMHAKLRSEDVMGAFDLAYDLAEALEAKLTRIEHALIVQKGRRDALRDDARRREFTA